YVALGELAHGALRAVHRDALDIVSAHFAFAHEIEQCFNRAVQATAAGVRLLSGTKDAKLATEVLDGRLGHGDRSRISRVEAAPRRVQDMAWPYQTCLREQRGTHAVLCSSPRVKALGHCAI